MTLRPFVAGIEFAPDLGFNWYYWKRPDANFWSRATSWGFYISHQLFIWGIIWWGKINRDSLRDRSKLHGLNIIALIGTVVFVALHYVQTAIWYDGLAQDLPVVSSQMSVILLLVIVLLLETPRRGLFFGAGKSWFANLRMTLVKYHGYYFAWAITFTYWYHPMELTSGHLLGFFYTFLLFVQAAFVFTRVHTNKYWTFVLEISVLIHGVTVALVAGQEFWPMFAFGFLILVVVTQLHGLGLPSLWKWIVYTLVAAAIVVVYSDRGWANLSEIFRIPIIDYVLVFVIGGSLLLLNRFKKRKSTMG